MNIESFRSNAILKAEYTVEDGSFEDGSFENGTLTNVYSQGM